MNYGKFNSAEELLKGYDELEKAFTKKCQELTEFQRAAAKKAEADGVKATAEVKESSDAANSELPQGKDAAICSDATAAKATEILPESKATAADSLLEIKATEDNDSDIWKASVFNNISSVLSGGTSAEASPQAQKISATTEKSAAENKAEPPTTVGSAGTVPQNGEFDAFDDLYGNGFASRFLASGTQKTPPPQIMRGGGNVSLAAPSRPKTIKEASAMALALFKE